MTSRTTMPMVDEIDTFTEQFVFPDLDKNCKRFPDYSRFSLTFYKNGLFSRFSMNPVSGKYEIWRCLVTDMER